MSGIEKGKDLIKEIKSLLLPRKEIMLAYFYGSCAIGRQGMKDEIIIPY